MSTIYVADPWDSLSPGFSGPPPGWTLFGNSTVSASDGAFPGHNFGSGFFSPLSSPTFFDPFPSSDNPKIQAMFGAQVNAAFEFQMALKGVSGDPIPVLKMIRESDNSLSLKTSSGPTDFLLAPISPPNRANSGLLTGSYFYPNVWYYFTLLIEVRADPSGSLLLEVSAQVIADGQTVIPGSKIAIIPLSFFPTTGTGSSQQLDSGFDQCNWFGGPGLSFLSQVQISDQFVPVPDPTIPVARVPQMVIEPGIIPVTANVRMNQALIEMGLLPVNSNVRISQMVIELATPFVAKGGVIPEYIKRRNLFANQ